MFPFNRADLLTISTVDRPDLREWIGRSLADLAAARGGHVSDALADWLIENRFDSDLHLRHRQYQCRPKWRNC